MSAAETATSGRYPSYGPFRARALVALRIVIGWHFFYEGLAKITNPYWTAAGYLNESQGWFSGFFDSLATNPGTLAMVDAVNQWGLLLIGLALMVGVFERTAALAGALFLLFYYAAAPPWPGLEYGIPMEGSYLIVNKVLVEMFALLVIVGFPTAHLMGLDRIIHWKRLNEAAGQAPASAGGA